MYKVTHVLFSLLLVACALTPIEPVSYTGGLPIYPAVNNVFTQKKITLASVDLFNDEYVSDYVYTKDLLLDLRFQVLVKKTGKFIQTDLVNMAFSGSDKVWKNTSSTLAFDINFYRNQLSQDIASILNDNTKYEAAKELALGDLGFVARVVKDLPEAGRLTWYEENMKGRTYKVNLPLLDVVRNTDSYIDKKYVARFLFSENSRSTDSLVSLNSRVGGPSQFFISLYTNNDNYSFAKKGSIVNTEGIMSSGDVDNVIRVDSLSLVEN